MGGEPRNWKWMIPGSFLFLMIVLTVLALNSAKPWPVVAIVPGGIGLICLVSAALNCRAYFRALYVDDFVRRRQAEILSPTTELARTLQGLHPAYSKILTMHLNTVWEIKEGGNGADLGIVDYILYGTRIPVHISFVVHVLKNSTNYSVMTEKMISEGSKQFDPTETVTDREQYMELIAYWKGQGRITSAHGNQPAAWIYPWTPELIAAAMDIQWKEGKDGEETDQEG